MPLVEQELLTLPGHLSSPPVFSGIRVTGSLVLCVCFVDRCLFFCTFSFGRCSLFFFDILIQITLWYMYLQTLLALMMQCYLYLCQQLKCLRGGERLSLLLTTTLSWSQILYIMKRRASLCRSSRVCQLRCCNMSPTLDVSRCLLVTYVAAPR